MSRDWTIPRGSEDWECEWAGDARFHLRYFKALSMTDKVRAVEAMCETADYFRRRVEARRADTDRPGES